MAKRDDALDSGVSQNRPKLRNLEHYTIETLLYFIKLQRDSLGYMKQVWACEDIFSHGLAFRSDHLDQMLAKLMSVWQKETLMRDAVLKLDINKVVRVEISIGTLTQTGPFSLILHPGVFLCLADRFVYDKKCMDYFTIDEHKVYWAEWIEVVVDGGVTLCEASKELWNEALLISLDIFRELGRRYPPEEDCWDPEEFVDHGVYYDPQTRARLFMHSPAVKATRPHDSSFYHPTLFESMKSFKPKKTLMTHRGGGPGVPPLRRKEWYLWGLPYFPVTGYVRSKQVDADNIEESFIVKVLDAKIDFLNQCKRHQFTEDLIITLKLDDSRPAVWRRFRCSPHVSLSFLGMHVIPAIIGWYSKPDNSGTKSEWDLRQGSYHFVDDSDGAVFSSAYRPTVGNSTQTQTQTISEVFGKRMIDDRFVLVGQLLRRPGAALVFASGQWRFTLTLDRTTPPAGRSPIVVLDGARAAPPLLSAQMLPRYEGFDFVAGNLWYQRTLLRHLSGNETSKDSRLTNELYRKMDPADRASFLSVSKHLGRPLDPFNFNLKKINENLTGSLRNSAPIALCNVCGSPGELKPCTVCKLRNYCSKRCNKKDARLGHRLECKKIKMQVQESQNEGIAGPIEDDGANGGVLLEHVHLEKRNLCSVPPNILLAPGAKNIKSLNISHNSLYEFPDALAEHMPCLEELNAANNQMERLPSSLASLSKLRILNLNDNQISKLPKELCQLPCLQRLNVNSNRLAEIEDLHSAKSLTHFEANDNLLMSLPALPGTVKTLEASGNQLSSVIVSTLTMLETLKLGNNLIANIDLSSLAHLIHVDLSHNRIQNLWDPCKSAHILESLLLHGNKIDSLPNWISSSKLRVLNLADNELYGVPFQDEFCFFQRRLHLLDLSGNCVGALPTAIGFFTELDHLDAGLSRHDDRRRRSRQSSVLSMDGVASGERLSTPLVNRIEEVPKSIGHMQKLRYLNFSGNSIKELPEEIEKLLLLENIDLSYNQLSSLPDSFCRLSRLETCDLSHNRILALPSAFGDLARLRHLWLDGNDLPRLPDSLASLKSLESLGLKGTQAATNQMYLALPEALRATLALVESSFQRSDGSRLGVSETEGAAAATVASGSPGPLRINTDRMNSDGGTDHTISSPDEIENDDDNDADEAVEDFVDDESLITFMDKKIKCGDFIISDDLKRNEMRRKERRGRLAEEARRKEAERRRNEAMETDSIEDGSDESLLSALDPEIPGATADALSTSAAANDSGIKSLDDNDENGTVVATNSIQDEVCESKLFGNDLLFVDLRSLHESPATGATEQNLLTMETSKTLETKGCQTTTSSTESEGTVEIEKPPFWETEDPISVMLEGIALSRRGFRFLDDVEVPVSPDAAEQSFLEAFVAAVDATRANVVWIQLRRLDPALARLIARMDDFYGSRRAGDFNPSKQVFAKGILVAAPAPYNALRGKWYRAQIRSLNPSPSSTDSRSFVVEVLYLDFGVVAELPLDEVLPLDERFLRPPPLAVECFLPDIMPPFDEAKDRRVWSKLAVDYFESLCMAGQRRPVKIRVVGRGFLTKVGQALAAKRRALLVDHQGGGAGAGPDFPPVGPWGDGAIAGSLDDAIKRVAGQPFQIQIFTSFGGRGLERLLDISRLMVDEGFANWRRQPEE